MLLINICLVVHWCSTFCFLFTFGCWLDHSLANRHSCLTPAKNDGIDIDSAGPIAEGTTNRQTIFVYL